MYLLPFYDTGCLHEQLINRDAADIIDIGFGYKGIMDFGFEYGEQHFLRKFSDFEPF